MYEVRSRFFVATPVEMFAWAVFATRETRATIPVVIKMILTTTVYCRIVDTVITCVRRRECSENEWPGRTSETRAARAYCALSDDSADFLGGDTNVRRDALV